ncbi:MAG: ATP-binding cassette domain-containing protein [Oscillospiraceae bacterium]|nr:ATP-binding cassette domain-containing protein [Oscillospiraceae bacterium]
MDIVISINNAVKKFRQAVVLNNVSAEFERGKVHGLIGRNGSGKTMLMKCICGIVPLTSGSVSVDGKIIGKDTGILKNAGVIIETPGFLSGYSAYDNLKFLASINRKIGKDEIKAAIRSVGLDPDDKKHVGKYSLGMRQRLGLAQAIMENPDLLILDEPMNGLDKDGVKDMRQYLLDLKAQGKTILIASHSAEDIDVLCDTVCEMDKGVLSKIR